MSNKDILYTTRWYASKIHETSDDPKVKKLASELIAEVTKELGTVAAPPKKVVVPALTKGKRLAIIVGHTAKAGGAYSKTLGQNEYVYNCDLAERMKAYAEKIGVDAFIEKRDIGGISGAVKRALNKKPQALIELHFNAANGKASGTETLYADHKDMPGVREGLLATLVNNAMVKALGLPNRGLKRMTSGRGYNNLLQTTHVASILTEPGFGDNPKDAASMRDNKQALAKGMVDAFVTWVSEEAKVIELTNGRYGAGEFQRFFGEAK